MHSHFTPTRLLFAFILVLCSVQYSFAQVSYEEAFPNISFNVPVEIQNAADGTNRMFVVEQNGLIKVFPNTSAVTPEQVTTFADLSQRVSYSAGQEIGLLGLAFHPQFSSNRYVFVYYIDRPSNYRINIVRYQVSASNANQIDTGSETIIAQFTKNQGESNHNGGKIAFGPDGYLYASIGDGGGGGDPQGNAQNLNTVFGSILRLDIDVDGNNPIESNPDLPNGNYEIPSDNPRVGQSGLDELYAWGIRNTWKFSFDTQGRLWGADVGQNAFEEINLISNGGNFGWNRFEGSADYTTNSSLVTDPDIKPVLSYGHSAGDKSVTGGYVYRGSLSSNALQNKYIYGDFVTGRVWALTYNATNGNANSELLFRANGESISSFGEDEAGELYFSSYGTGKIFKLSETVTGPTTTAVNGIGAWKPIGNGTNGSVETVTKDSDGNIYVGGTFTNAGDSSRSNLARISSNEQWQSFGSDSNGTIHVVEIAPNGNVYIGGEFTQIGGIQANNIAFWNGENWSGMGSGTNGAVLALAFDTNGVLYVGGIFSAVNGQTVNNVAQWQNNDWSALTDNATNIAGTNNEIRSLDIDGNNNLYIGGNFDTAGGVSTSRIAKWNGTNWTALGSGTSGFVQAIEIVNGFLYAGGNFNLAGGSTVNRIARYNLSSNSWEPLGAGLSGSVNALEWDGNYIYAGGNFETASNTENNNIIVNNIARWNSSQGWQALGPNTLVGVNSSISTLSFSDSTGELHAGGSFSSSGDINANNIAVWSEDGCSENSIIQEYQVNGIWDSGNNTLTVNEGDTLILSILPNNTNFTVLLPNGETRQGDYNLGSLTTDLAGTYVFTTAQGCTENFELIINPASNNDLDNDGVPNDLDTCPDTQTGETVNATGCSSSQLDDDNDGVLNSDDRCPNTPEGESVDSFGCDASQNDVDNDGVLNDADNCPNTPAGETVDINGCSDSQLDDDFDGVNNASDQCPNTPEGATVNDQGCEDIGSFPDDRFNISTILNSCEVGEDGQINVAASLTADYTALLTNADGNTMPYPFTDTLNIDQLDTGTYTLCITETNASNLESCFSLTIDASSSLLVETILNETGTSVVLNLSGATKYFIALNEKRLETESNEITIELDKDVNTLAVTSDVSCHTIYEETIVMKDAFIVYPNPIDNFVSIDVSQLSDEQIEVSLFSATGKLLLNQNNTTEEDIITIDTSSLAPGYFVLRISGTSIEKAFKLIK